MIDLLDIDKRGDYIFLKTEKHVTTDDKFQSCITYSGVGFYSDGKIVLIENTRLFSNSVKAKHLFTILDEIEINERIEFIENLIKSFEGVEKYKL